MNKKFNFDVNDLNVKNLYLTDNNLNITIFDYLCQLQFEELKDINLSHNKLVNIKQLAKAKFEKLEILNLSWNKISDIKY